MTRASNSSWWIPAPSAVSYHTVRKRRRPALSFPAPTGEPFRVHLRLSFELRTFFVTFLLAAVYRPILGLDFLSAHGLLVDPVGRQVLDSKTLKPLSKPPAAAGTLRSKSATAEPAPFSHFRRR